MSAAPTLTRLTAASGGFDLDAYFHRIGYDGPREPTLEVLHTLHQHHAQAIPFENLDPFMGVVVDLDIAHVQAKLAGSRRGGYCYEHNLLFMRALQTLGFNATGLAARVLWNLPEDALTPRSHQLLLVENESEKWIADVGFGGVTLTAPLRLEPGLVQETPHERFRLLETDDHFRLQAEIAGEWRTVYRFDLAAQYDDDYRISSYYLSANPASQFVTGLTAARTAPGRRYALRRNEFAVHEIGGETTRRSIGTAEELADLLDCEFGIAVPDRAAFAEMVAAKKIIPGG